MIMFICLRYALGAVKFANEADSNRKATLSVPSEQGGQHRERPSAIRSALSQAEQRETNALAQGDRFELFANAMAPPHMRESAGKMG
ncbi:MAG: hypothetical protein E5Y79_09995 [Mesorhizobium sp.]|uniref:hypothetical protein n=1 Tax=Mesorhizobium sp. TaxID=1871066 RepID=UPI00120D04F1|nr:hypothetical protein [Mesorhizobium sp.]TIL60584.1 MAG: hypothetical protein E5Y79_09995 [Mesorhizobium sp.]